MLDKLLALHVPVSVVFSASTLGDDAFLVITAADFDAHLFGSRQWRVSKTKGIREYSLSRAEQYRFRRIAHQWRLIHLGAWGVAYEPAGQDFPTYYRNSLTALSNG